MLLFFFFFSDTKATLGDFIRQKSGLKGLSSRCESLFGYTVVVFVNLFWLTLDKYTLGTDSAQFQTLWHLLFLSLTDCMMDNVCSLHRTTWRTSSPTTASITSACLRECTLTALSWWSWATLLRMDRRTPPRSTALPSPTHHSTCKTKSELQTSLTVWWALRLVPVLGYSVTANLKWTVFAQLIYCVLTWYYVGHSRKTQGQIFTLFTVTALYLHMSHPHIHAPFHSTQNDTNFLISAWFYLPLPAVRSWQLSPLHTQPVVRSSLFGLGVVHISVTTVMSPANLYHFVSHDQRGAWMMYV